MMPLLIEPSWAYAVSQQEFYEGARSVLRSID